MFSARTSRATFHESILMYAILLILGELIIIYYSWNGGRAECSLCEVSADLGTRTSVPGVQSLMKVVYQ